jgi:hypothetical protein
MDGLEESFTRPRQSVCTQLAHRIVHEYCNSSDSEWFLLIKANQCLGVPTYRIAQIF